MKQKKVFNCYKRCILQVADQVFPNIRQKNYSLSYYLDNFINVLNEVNKWKSLNLINKNSCKYYWKSIYNEYNKWCSHDIFRTAFNDFLKKTLF